MRLLSAFGLSALLAFGVALSPERRWATLWQLFFGLCVGLHGLAVANGPSRKMVGMDRERRFFISGFHWRNAMFKKAWMICLIIVFVITSGVESQQSEKGRPIEIDVDASEVVRKILHARLTIPVTPGPLTLFYPKWIPGEHGPTGPIADLAGLKISAGGSAIPWYRDETDMYAFHCEVPSGAKAIEVNLDFLSPPPATEGFTSGASATTQLAILNWNQLLLYPKGRPAREIEFQASLTLPAGWRLGTALPMASQSGRQTKFAPVSLEALVDSPVLCGKHFREVAIGPPGSPSHFLEIACDSEQGVELNPDLKTKHDRLVAEAKALFGMVQ